MCPGQVRRVPMQWRCDISTWHARTWTGLRSRRYTGDPLLTMLWVGAVLRGCQCGGHLSRQLHLVLDGAILAAGAKRAVNANRSTSLQALKSLASHKDAEELSC